MPSVIIKQVSSRSHVITLADHGMILDFGPAATASSVGTFVMQFNPDATSDYTATLMGRCWGQAAADLNMPFVPIPYRRVTVANAASDYNISTSVISGVTLIQVPANWSIGLFISIATGSCGVASWNLNGSSAP